jgi:hypothetical protein
MNRFEIILHDNPAEIEIITTRALLAIAGVASFVYVSEQNYYVGAGLGLLLLLLSFFVKTLLNRYKLNRLLLLGIAALLTYITTRSIALGVVLLIYGIFFKLLQKKIKVEVDSDAITIHYVFYQKRHAWAELNNIILKDRILTVDLASNKLIQSETDKESFEIDEKMFNTFCAEQLQKIPGNN